MALENDFLVFAGASGANVLSQSAYASASATATGYVSGVASSAAINKTLRQTSIMSSMIAQFIVDKAAQPVVDDGTIATIETNFEAAILAIAQTVNLPIGQVTGLSAALAGLLPLHATADAAAKLATARNIALTGAVTGAVNFDGSANVSIATTLANLTANTLLGNPTGSAATPQAITLASPLVFSGSSLGLSYTPVNKAGDTMTGALSGTSISLTGALSASGVSAVGATSATYTAMQVSNPSGVTAQFSANGSGEGEVRTVTSHPLAILTNNSKVASFGTNGVLSLFPTQDISTHGVNTANIICNAPSGSVAGGCITFNHVNGDQWCAYPLAGTFNVGYTTGGGGPVTKFTVNTSGNVTASGTIQPGSDGRVKYERVKIQNALEIVRTCLVGHTYRRKDQDGAMQAGFIADSVQVGLPHLVSESKEPFNGYERFKTLDYNGAEAYLANAITELYEMVLELKSKGA